MDPKYETTNARAWDEDTVVSIPASTRPASATTALNNTTATSRAENFRPVPPRPGASSGSQYRGPQLQQQINNARHPTRNQEGRNGSRHGNLANGRPSSHLPFAKTVWAEPPRLVTNRRATEREKERRKEADLKSFLNPPIDQEGISDIGYYLWPSKSEHAEKYFGWQLVQLDPVRIACQVHIEDMVGTQYLKISCPSFHDDPEQSIAQALNSIRSAIEDARAKEMRASPLYIVIPPTASGMRSIVKPANVTKEKVDIMARAFSTDHDPIWRKVYKASGLELLGDMLSEDERLEWNSKREQMIQSNLKKFEEHLLENFMILASVKGLMRMRLHFGHVVLKEYTKTFKRGQMGFEGFKEMMAVNFMETEFNSEIEDPNVALELRRTIMEWPERFRPVEAKTLSLDEVEWKDTAIILLKNERGQRYRIEADVDRLCETNEGEYQLGCIRLFYDNKTNRRIRVENIDVERQLDYTLEVNSDNAIYEVPDNLLSMIKDSVTPKSPVREDTLGLNYPHVSPKYIPGLEVSEVSVRSVAQYMLSTSGYIVEIGIHRQWDSINTNREPKNITSSVVMFHSNWDWNMRSLEEIPGAGERGWSRNLCDFFEPDAEGANGFAGFITEVRTVQGYLVDAFKVCNERVEKALELLDWDTESEEVPAPKLDLNPEGEPFVPASETSPALESVPAPATVPTLETSFHLIDLE